MAAARVAYGLLLAALALLVPSAHAGSEEARMAQYVERGHKWPADVKPNTKAYRELMRRREAQVMSFEGAQDRWDGWNNLVKQAVMPNFTKHGYALVEAPKALHKKLHAALHAGMADATEEGGVAHVQEIEVDGLPNSERPSGQRPTFVHAPALMNDVLHELLPLHEQWTTNKIKLLPSIAYGMRVYHNLSGLLMHIDKIDTHVISCILHVDHEYDNDDEPWPIEIEDHSGKVQAIDLKPGQMLMYESAKCMHGRPKVFRGKFYSSVFVHYRPAVWDKVDNDVEYAIPPHWIDPISDHPEIEELARTMPRMKIGGTGMINADGVGFDSVFKAHEHEL